jgi:YcxB-like protein
MRLEYQLTLSDLRAGLRLHKPGRSASRVVGILACLALIGLGAVLFLVQGTPDVIADVRRWASVSLWVGVALLLVLLTQEWTLQRFLRRRAAAEEPIHVAVGENGLQAEARGTKATIEWERICRFRESGDHFLLYHSPDQYFILPKRAFGADQDVAAFRAMAQRVVTRG